MARQVMCDRCGHVEDTVRSVSDEETHIKDGTVLRRMGGGVLDAGECLMGRIDLCKDCTKLFATWLDSMSFQKGSK